MSRPFRLIMDEEVLSERGTSVAIYDYAQALRTYQNVDPIIAFNRNLSTDVELVGRFKAAFETVSYADHEDREKLVAALKADRYYCLKDRKRHGRAFRDTETIVHLAPEERGLSQRLSRRQHGANVARSLNLEGASRLRKRSTLEFRGRP